MDEVHTRVSSAKMLCSLTVVASLICAGTPTPASAFQTLVQNQEPTNQLDAIAQAANETLGVTRTGETSTGNVNAQVQVHITVEKRQQTLPERIKNVITKAKHRIGEFFG